MEMIRAFVAIELDDAVKGALVQAQNTLKRAPVGRLVRWVSPDGIHLTLKFLGDISSDRVTDITRSIERGCGTFSPFRIALSEAGFFPNAHRLRVVWVGVGGEVEHLLRLQRSVEAELGTLGFPPEGRGFQPHLTLGRVRDSALSAEREELAKRIATTQVEANAAMTVEKVRLIRSELRPTGAVYTTLAAVPLG